MSDAAEPTPAEASLLSDALESLPHGVAIFDADWSIIYVNPAGARLLARRREELTGRNIWIALPELGGTIFHSFLLHARGVRERVTWQGFYAPSGRWLHATAVRVAGRLHVDFAEVGDRIPESALPVEEPGPAGDEVADHDRLRFLAEVSESLITTLDTGDAMTMLCELVVPRLCDWAVVAVLGEEGAPPAEARAHRDPARLPDLDTYLAGRVTGGDDDNPMALALLTGEPIQLTGFDPALIDPSLPTDEVRAAWKALDATSCVIVPLRARSETFGALGLMNSGDRPPHTEMQIATTMEVARRASLALDNARLYGRQLKVAETLQHSLLTPPPQPDDLEIAVRYRPASTTMHVGGDWYDAFQQPDGATLLVIGDVVGHNVDAAAAMGQIRSIVRGIAFDRQEAPARLLTRVDGVLTGLRIGTLATALIARIEQPAGQAAPGVRTLRWSSAGHLPPLLLHATGRVEVLDTRPETLLGTESPGPRTDHEVRIEPGSTVFFYTDGLVECGRTAIDEGITRLAGWVEALGGAAVDDLCDEVLGRVSHERSDDDIAIVAVRFHAAS